MHEEDEEPTEEKASHMAEAKMLVEMRKAVVPKLPDQ